MINENKIRDKIKNVLMSIVQSAFDNSWSDSEKSLLSDLGFIYDDEDLSYNFKTKNNLITIEKLDNPHESEGVQPKYKILVIHDKNVIDDIIVRGEKNLFLATTKFKNEY